MRGLLGWLRAKLALRGEWRRLRDEAPSLANVDYNRRLWDLYAGRWDLIKETVAIEDPSVTTAAERARYLEHLGDEWGDKASVAQVLDEYVLPFLAPDRTSVVGEIGPGGGRVASRVAPLCREFFAFDISENMLAVLRRALAAHAHVRYVLLTEPRLDADLAERFDFLYAFDAMVHMDLHTQWRYLQEMARVLKRGGRAFIHTTNLTAPEGWRKFAAQERYAVEGHYFVTPDLVRLLVAKAGLRVVKDSTSGATANYYTNRDYLALLEKS